MIQLTCKACNKQFDVETLKNVLVKVMSPDTGEVIQVPACTNCQAKLVQKIEDTRVIFFFGADGL